MSHKYTLEDQKNSRKKLIITEIAPEILAETEKIVLNDLSKSMNIKGFRPGKIPENIIREQVEESYLKMHSMEKAVPRVASEIIEKEKLRVIGHPRMDFESLDPLKVLIEFDVFPSFKLGDYKKISVKVSKKTAGDKDVEDTIKHFKKQFTEYHEVKRAAKMGDKVEIDFEGFTADGVPLENTRSKNHPVILGSKMLIPGF